MARMTHARVPGPRPTEDGPRAKPQIPVSAPEAKGERASAVSLSRGATRRGDLNDGLEAKRPSWGR
jgi:hypothetical protein